MTHRSLRDIAADIAAAKQRLGRLQIERKQAYAAQRAGVIRDFDAGKRVDVIATTWGLTEEEVRTFLYSNGRSELSRKRERVKRRLRDNERKRNERKLRHATLHSGHNDRSALDRSL